MHNTYNKDLICFCDCSGSASHRWVCDGTKGINGRKGGAVGSGGGAQASIGGVTCLDHHDMTGDGVKDLIVARDGGAIQVSCDHYRIIGIHDTFGNKL